MKGPLADERRDSVAAKALELARTYLKGLHPGPHRQFAVNARKSAERYPQFSEVFREFMGSPPGWTNDIVADAEAGDAIAVQAIQELAAAAIACGAPVPERYRPIIARILRGKSPRKRSGRYKADHRVRDMRLISAVFLLVERDGFSEDQAVKAATSAATEVGCNVSESAIRTVYKSTPPERLCKKTGNFLLGAMAPEI